MRIVKIPLIDWCHKTTTATDKIDEQLKEAVEHARSTQVTRDIVQPVEVSQGIEKRLNKEAHDTAVEELIAKTRAEAYEEAKMHFDAEKEEWTKDKPKDWAFMKQSGEVLKHYPPTWMQYPNNEEGMIKIIEMEYGEVMAARMDQLGADAVSHELVHLASACLLLWRRLNHAE